MTVEGLDNAIKMLQELQVRIANKERVVAVVFIADGIDVCLPIKAPRKQSAQDYLGEAFSQAITRAGLVTQAEYDAL